jgi:hypothetical protein
MRSFVCCLLVITLASVAFAREPNGAGRLAGAITAGPSAVPIVDARVSVRVDGAGRRADIVQSNGDGEYAFDNLPVDKAYAVTVEGRGFRAVTRTGIQLRAGETTRLDVHLELADVRDAVIVPGATDSAQGAGTVSQTIDERDIRELPSVTRSATKYALLDPHVRQAIGLGADFQDATRLSINAGSYRHTASMLDGVSTYDWIYANSPQVSVPPGALAEMQILTGPYSAQYGLSTTGLISMTTAAGSSRFAGEAFVYARPSGLQARPPVSTFRVPNERTSGGFEAGGPLWRDAT